LLFQRVRVRFADGFRECRVVIRRSPLTRNLHGTTFGGTIFAAADPIHAIMYWQRFARAGEHVQAWTRRGAVRYLEPATGHLVLRFRLEDADLAAARAALDREGRFVRTHPVEARDAAGRICAVVENEVYLRHPTGEGRGSAAF
jgi:acyl-coenzyme A thioesterase PaaI-like protein